MTSGIYKLIFSDGSFYIGKSNDIPKRWKQHRKSFEQGTHTKSMQAAYSRCGSPSYTIIRECHSDHIDIMENYYIGLHWNSDHILNSTKPVWYNDGEVDIILNSPPVVWEMSTFDHIWQWHKATLEIDVVDKKLKESKNAKKIQELHGLLDELSTKYAKLKHRGLLSRIFNLES